MFIEFVLKRGEHIVETTFLSRCEILAVSAVVVTLEVAVVAIGILAVPIELFTVITAVAASALVLPL